MDGSSHSPEPWSVVHIDDELAQIYAIGCRAIGGVAIPIADADRIVSCVNFLAGLSTDELTRERHVSETSLIKLLIMMTPEKQDLSQIVTDQMVTACTDFLRGQGYTVTDDHE